MHDSNLYFLLIVLQIVSSDTWIWYPFWILMGAVFIAEKVWTVRDAGWKARLLASTLVIELLYDTFLGIVFVKGTVDMAFGRQANWGDEHKHKTPRHSSEQPHVAKHRSTKRQVLKNEAKK
jgi:hypothetical protein